MLHTKEEFVRQICEDPADDVARLVFADWLDENGEGERAEFIRVQCELARTPPVEKLTLYCGETRRLGGGKRRVAFKCNRLLSQTFPAKELIGQTVDIAPPFPGSGLHMACVVDGAADYSDGRHISVEGEWIEEWPDEWHWKHEQKRNQLQAREQELLCRAIETGKSPVPGWTVFNAPSKVFFRGMANVEGTGTAARGFIDRFGIAVTTFLEKAGEIFAINPVTSVVLSRTETHQVAGRFWWYAVDNLDFDPGTKSDVVNELFYALPADESGAEHFDTAKDALEWLSKRCVAFGRRKAGLPMLPEHTKEVPQ